MHPENMEPILTTFEVSIFVKLTSFNEEQPKNIEFISFTDDMFKFEKSIVSKELHP